MIRRQIEALKKYTRFCTPGHKGKLNSLDVTEIEGVFPLDYVFNAQINAAKTLDVNALRFLVNGSSIGIKAALMSVKGDILAASNCHQSICEAAILSSKRLFKVENIIVDGLKLPLTKQQIKEELEKNPSVGAVVLAHPDYYGLNCNLDAARYVIAQGKQLYLDCAHGAHYLFRPDLFCTKPLSLAYAFNLSAHKTLFAPTQTAYLCINDASLAQTIDYNLTLLSSTSPYYPFYAYLDEAIAITKENAHKYEQLKQFHLRLNSKFRLIKNDDFTRIVIDANAYALSGEQLHLSLLKRKIFAEKFDSRYVVFILTLADDKKHLKRLERALEEICLKAD